MITRIRTFRVGVAAFSLALATLLPSCAFFQPRRVAINYEVTETLPPLPALKGKALSSSAAAPRSVFVPGRAGRTGKANYASAPGVTASEIKIGIIVPMDGPMAELGRPVYRSTQAYVNMLNARGGINGRKVKLILQTACTNCEAEVLLAAKALVEQKGVFAIVNTYMNTYGLGPALKYLNEKKVPLIQGWSGTGDESMTWSNAQTPWSVYFTIRNDDAVQMWAGWMSLVNAKWQAAGKLPNPQHPYWVATVSLDVSMDRYRAAEFKKVWESKGSEYKVVSQQYVAAQEESVTRMDSFIAAMKDAKANAVFSASNVTMVFGMQAAARQSWKVPWVTKSAWGRAATDNCGPPCSGAFTDNNGWGWSGIDTPQMRQYYAAMRAYYSDGVKYADTQTLGGWIGMMGFEYAATQLGADLTRKGLISKVGNLKGFDTGVGAQINTSPTDHLGMGQFMMLQICKNEFHLVSDWLSPGGAMKRVSSKGDCGWGY
ncbi:MAG: ABC transporter substrate-binding protein [Actinomycetota bacterium]